MCNTTTNKVLFQISNAQFQASGSLKCTINFFAIGNLMVYGCTLTCAFAVPAWLKAPPAGVLLATVVVTVKVAPLLELAPFPDHAMSQYTVPGS